MKEGLLIVLLILLPIATAEAECNIFLTEDRKLLDMKFFGKVKIDQQLTQS